tara:strand:+ start:1153 stop:2208 length:1056 start_codon:yes stop_codon:yes gene_type:complete
VNNSILVTGGTGFIGSHTCINLIEKGYKIIVLDSLINSTNRVIKRIENIVNPNIKNIHNKIDFFEGDLRDKDLLQGIFEKYKNTSFRIKGVIHFAGLKSVKESIENPLEYWSNNVVSTINLLEIMKKYNCFNLVFSSSATVYGYSEGGLLNEDSHINPINTYGRTKAVIEQILQDIYKSSSNKWKIVNLRYFNPIGAHPSGMIGEDPKGLPNNIFPLIIKVASREIGQLEIYGNDWDTPDGTGIRDYIHVMDLAEGHVKALEMLNINFPNIININLGTGFGTSVLELLKTFEKVNHEVVPYKFVGRRKGDYGKVIAENNLARKILDWSPKRNLEEMCKDGWRWKLKNPDGY